MKLVGIFSRGDESSYRWLVNKIVSWENVWDVRPVTITNNFEKLREETAKCDFAILYHSKNRGRINITDVTDSLYDAELQYLSTVYGKKNVLVVIDDLGDSSDEQKYKILSNQPSIQRLAQDLFLFSSADKAALNTLAYQTAHNPQRALDQMRRIIEGDKKRTVHHKDTSDSRKQIVSNKKYRVEVQSMFHCQETGIKFEVESTTDIKYSLEYGEEYMMLIQEKGYELLGPIFNVEVLSGRVSAIYLPHYVCLEGFGGGQARIKCCHFKDGKVTLITPTRIEASYVVLDNPTFSCITTVGEYFTSFLRWIFSTKKQRKKLYPFNGKVLIYFRVVSVEDEKYMEYRVHLYVIPANKPHLKKLNDLKRPDGFKRVDKPNQISNVYTKTNYIISGKPEPKINPKTLQFMVHEEIENLPFTEINFPKETEKISLRLEEENGSGPVWIGELTRADIKELSGQAVQRGVSSEYFILRNRSDLIQKVKNIKPVLDDLIRQELLTEEQCNTVRSQATPQDQMRELLRYVVNWGREDRDTFYQVVKDHNKSCIKEIEKSN